VFSLSEAFWNEWIARRDGISASRTFTLFDQEVIGQSYNREQPYTGTLPPNKTGSG